MLKQGTAEEAGVQKDNGQPCEKLLRMGKEIQGAQGIPTDTKVANFYLRIGSIGKKLQGYVYVGSRPEHDGQE